MNKEERKIVIKFLEACIYLFVIGLFVDWFWQGIEIIMLGRIYPDEADTIIAIVLTISIYFNIKLLNKPKDEEHKAEENKGFKDVHCGKCGKLLFKVNPETYEIEQVDTIGTHKIKLYGMNKPLLKHMEIKSICSCGCDITTSL